MADYQLRKSTPSVATYCHLREVTGLSPKTEEAARIGLAGGLFAVEVLHEDQTVGMGRLIGDGGCFFQIVDIAVLPEHQGQGLGKLIMKGLMAYVEEELPKSAYVSLIADGNANHLYAKFGFEPTAPASIGMARKL